MIGDMITLLTERRDFFLGLLWEHLQISLAAIVIAIVVGGVVGICISEFEKSAKPTLAVINFLYTIPSISRLGFLIPFSGVGNATAIIALTVYALLPMVRNTHTGIASFIGAGGLGVAIYRGITTNNGAMTMAGSSRGWVLPGRWQRPRKYCSWTSPLGPWTRSQEGSCRKNCIASINRRRSPFVEKLVEKERRTCSLPENQLKDCQFSGAAVK